MKKPRLTMADYARAAIILGTGTSEVRAVTKVESGGKGFLDDGRVIIRFEPHIFHRYTDGKFDKSHPHLSFPVRKKGYPKNVEQSWALFNEAAKLKPNAAVLACSWGMFQIMAFNYSACGCKNLNEFVARMEESEAQHLDMFCKLLVNWGLNDELQRHEWDVYARFYNGPGYKDNNYDVLLAQANAEYSGDSTIV